MYKSDLLKEKHFSSENTKRQFQDFLLEGIFSID